MKNKFLLIAERLKPFGFSIDVLRKDALVVLRYTLEGHLRQDVQVIELDHRKSKISLDVDVCVLDRIGDERMHYATTYILVGDNIDRYGRYGRRIDDYEGWGFDEIEAVADIAVNVALPWLDNWNDPEKIIQFLLDDIKQREIACAAWDEQAAKKPTLWQRLRGYRAPDPFYRPAPTPPGHWLALANLYLYVDDKQEAARYLEQVCASRPRWKKHRAFGKGGFFPPPG